MQLDYVSCNDDTLIYNKWKARLITGYDNVFEWQKRTELDKPVENNDTERDEFVRILAEAVTRVNGRLICRTIDTFTDESRIVGNEKEDNGRNAQYEVDPENPVKRRWKYLHESNSTDDRANKSITRLGQFR